MTWSPVRRAVVGAVLVGVVVAASLAASPSATVTAIESVADDPFAFGLAVAALYLVRPLFAWPTTPLSVVVGYGFGVALGVPVAMAGILVTVIPPFLVARWLADGDGVRPAGPTTATSDDGFDSGGGRGPSTADGDRGRLEPLVGNVVGRANGAIGTYFTATGPIRGVVVARLLPIPSDVATVAAAVAGVRLRHLLAGTAVGELPWTVAAVVLGASAATITAAGLDGVGWPVVLACVLAGLALLAGPVVRLATGGSPSVAEAGVDGHSDADADADW